MKPWINGGGGVVPALALSALLLSGCVDNKTGPLAVTTSAKVEQLLSAPPRPAIVSAGQIPLVVAPLTRKTVKPQRQQSLAGAIVARKPVPSVAQVFGKEDKEQ